MLFMPLLWFGGDPASQEVMWCDGPWEDSGMGRRGGEKRWGPGVL